MANFVKPYNNDPFVGHLSTPVTTSLSTHINNYDQKHNVAKFSNIIYILSIYLNVYPLTEHSNFDEFCIVKI